MKERQHDFGLNLNECHSSMKLFTSWLIQYCNICVVYIFFFTSFLAFYLQRLPLWIILRLPLSFALSYFTATKLMSSPLTTPIYLVLGLPLGLSGFFSQTPNRCCPTEAQPVLGPIHPLFCWREPQHLHLYHLQDYFLSHCTAYTFLHLFQPPFVVCGWNPNFFHNLHSSRQLTSITKTSLSVSLFPLTSLFHLGPSYTIWHQTYQVNIGFF